MCVKYVPLDSYCNKGRRHTAVYFSYYILQKHESDESFKLTMFEESMVNVLIQQICAKSSVHITSKLENDIVQSMLSVRDIKIVRLQFKILNSRAGFSITKHVNKRLTVTSNDKFEIWLKTSFFTSSCDSFSYKYFSIGDHDTERRKKIYLLGPIIIYLFILFATQ